jgi:pyridoxine 5-phosphate synthase
LVARLSVNLNKIALLRNARRTGVPDLLHFARLVHEAGAHGITVHPRPDERHIRRADVPALAGLIAPWRPSFEFNIEGYPDEAFLALVARVAPQQCTLVPDAPGVLTSEEGWRIDAAQLPVLRDAVARLHAHGSRVILFVDPDPAVVARVPETGADGIEIYTGGYATAFREGAPAQARAACAATAREAVARDLLVNIGHDLNLQNLPPLLRAMPPVAEASIGHELTADALLMGWAAAIRAYRNVLAGRPRGAGPVSG